MNKHITITWDSIPDSSTYVTYWYCPNVPDIIKDAVNATEKIERTKYRIRLIKEYGFK